MGLRFAERAAEIEREIVGLQQRVRDGQAAATCWKELSDQRRTSVSLARECLAAIQGALSRRLGLDGGVLRFADLLLAGLSAHLELGWESPTVLAENEFYGEDAQIIRLRFPQVSVWDLPVAVHEFGHYAGPRLSARVRDGRYWGLRHPASDLLEEAFTAGPMNWSHQHELVADAFAVFVSGPAYLCDSVLLRFDPRTAHVDGPTHPASAKRVQVMLHILERMNDPAVDATKPYGAILKILRTRWHSSMAASGGQDLTADVSGQVEKAARTLWEMLDATIRTKRYGGMAGVQQLKRHLDQPGPARPGPALAAPASAIAAGAALMDVLNAAWLCRIDHWADDRDLVPAIGANAWSMCDAIVAQTSAHHDGLRAVAPAGHPPEARWTT